MRHAPESDISLWQKTLEKLIGNQLWETVRDTVLPVVKEKTVSETMVRRSFAGITALLTECTRSTAQDITLIRVRRSICLKWAAGMATVQGCETYGQNIRHLVSHKHKWDTRLVHSLEVLETYLVACDRFRDSIHQKLLETANGMTLHQLEAHFREEVRYHQLLSKLGLGFSDEAFFTLTGFIQQRCPKATFVLKNGGRYFYVGKIPSRTTKKVAA